LSKQAQNDWDLLFSPAKLMALKIPDAYIDRCEYFKPEPPLRTCGFVVARLGLIVADVRGEPGSLTNNCYPDTESPLRWYALIRAAYLAASIESLEYHKQQAPRSGDYLSAPTPLDETPTLYPNVTKGDQGPLYPIAKTIHAARGPNHTGPVEGSRREDLREAYVVVVQRHRQHLALYMPAVAIPQKYHADLDEAIEINKIRGMFPINFPNSAVRLHSEWCEQTDWLRNRIQVTDFPLLAAD
jgi:hypothetical protein